MEFSQGKNGWHRSSGYCVYVEDGMVIKYFKDTDKQMRVKMQNPPVSLNTFTCMHYRQKKRNQKGNKD